MNKWHFITLWIMLFIIICQLSEIISIIQPGFSELSDMKYMFQKLLELK